MNPDKMSSKTAAEIAAEREIPETLYAYYPMREGFIKGYAAGRESTVERAARADATDIETHALDLTEGIWPRVKGISQDELLALAKRCIRKGMELRAKTSIAPKH